jgi:hypothetical protein
MKVLNPALQSIGIRENEIDEFQWFATPQPRSLTHKRDMSASRQGLFGLAAQHTADI